MAENVFIKSEQGAKAAWKGFSSQTAYIAYRLLFLNDEHDFYPEKAEDLMLKKDNVTTELVQVKNLSADLALSHFSPKESDSFFRRCLSFRSNDEIVLKIVSFGSIGQELSGLRTNLESSIKSIKTKLTEYEYSDSDINWLLLHLEIEKVDEPDLVAKIRERLGNLIETMAAPDVVLDVLTNYVSRLSRNGEPTSRTKWNDTIQKIGLDLASVSGVARQYGNTIFPIYEYKNNLPTETLKNEYKIGVNALPQHIKANLDVIRSLWLGKISAAFENSQIVIIRGASGQGKSSLAYRYLLNNYPECDILCIENVTGSEQASDIYTALSGISKHRRSDLIAYIDVVPYDTNWVWLCERFNSHGDNLKLLITIREEDFRRSPIDYSKYKFSDIALSFDKAEAQELFNLYNNQKYLSFENAWNAFGGEGPLMEFTYMMNESDTLKNKLSAQINNIILYETYADEWLHILSIISYSGMYGIPVNLNKLLTHFEHHQSTRMLKTFEMEYLIRPIDDRRYVECLHAIRARILHSVIKDITTPCEIDLLLHSLISIDGNALMMLVSYIYANGVNNDFINAIASLPFNGWPHYASILKALLWSEVYAFYQCNKQFINEGNILFNGSFVMLYIGDATGYYGVSNIVDELEINKPGIKNAAANVLDKFNRKTFSYDSVDNFIRLTFDSLPLDGVLSSADLTPAGYSLFWLAQRHFEISEEKCKLKLPSLDKIDSLDNVLNYLIGVQEQNWKTSYESIRRDVQKVIDSKYNIVYFDDSNDTVSAISIVDVFHNSEVNQIGNEYIMSIIYALRRLYSKKNRYAVKLIGQNVIEGIVVPDNEKNIPAENLPWVWITQLNRWLNNLDEYENSPLTWQICLKSINETRSLIVRAANGLINGLKYLYKRRSIQSFISHDMISLFEAAINHTRLQHQLLPKTERDKFGINLNNAVVYDLNSSYDPTGNLKNSEASFITEIKKYFFYISLFLKHKDALIVEKLKNIQISNEGRLSSINIISAIDRLFYAVSLYDVEFALLNIPFDKEYERNRLLLLAAIWVNLYEKPLAINDSILHNRFLYILDYRQRIVSFFESDVAHFDGVISFSKCGRKVDMVVDPGQAEEICLRIFNEFKSKFPEISTLTFESLLMDEYISKINIRFQLGVDVMPGGKCISGDLFKTYSEPDKFMKFLTPIESDNEYTGNKFKILVATCFSYVSALYMFLRHLSQVQTAVSNLEAQYINQKVYDSWVTCSKEFNMEVIDEIISCLTSIYSESLIVGEEIQTNQLFNDLLSLLKDIRAIGETIYDESDLDRIREFFVILIDAIPQEIFQ